MLERFLWRIRASKSETRMLRTFIISVTLAVTLCIAGAFIAIAVRDGKLIQEQMLIQARIEFKNILRFGNWNNTYSPLTGERIIPLHSTLYFGTIMRNSKQSITKSQYLPNKLETAKIQETRLRRDEGLFYHVVSLKPLNPQNYANSKEYQAIKAFQKGEKEQFWPEMIDEKPYIRYMAPIYMKESCFHCHKNEGYKAGDVRGGICISFELLETTLKLRSSLRVIMIGAGITMGILLTTIYFFFRKLTRKLQQARHLLEVIATTDSLTGIYNRRYVMQRLEEEFERQRRVNGELSCILMDIDHFKRVNDRFGHDEGDRVLRKVAEQMMSAVRSYDVLGRLGGEEFLAVLPDTGLQTAISIAERLRKSVEENVTVLHSKNAKLSITITAGVTYRKIGDSIESMIKRADQALYRGKNNGRNRVEVDQN